MSEVRADLPHRAARDLLACLRFFTRLPLPAPAFEAPEHGAPDLSRIGWMAPFAGSGRRVKKRRHASRSRAARWGRSA